MSVKGVKEYDVTFKDNRRFETNSTSVNVKLLYSGTKYTFEVSAVTGGGEGENVSISVDVSESDKSQFLCHYIYISEITLYNLVLFYSVPEMPPGFMIV